MNEQHQSFEDLKIISPDEVEYWSARALAPLLEYKDWRNFQKVIGKAVQACESSGYKVSDHFVEATKMVSIGSGTQRPLEDINLFIGPANSHERGVGNGFSELRLSAHAFTD